MLTSKVEKVTFGLLLLLAVVGNCGWPSSNGLAGTPDAWARIS